MKEINIIAYYKILCIPLYYLQELITTKRIKSGEFHALRIKVPLLFSEEAQLSEAVTYLFIYFSS